MAFKTKYNPGDRIGPYNTLFVERTYKNKNGHWYGIFECSHCEEHKHFEASVSNIATGRIKSCGCLAKQANKTPRYKYKVGDKVGPYGCIFLEEVPRKNPKKRRGKFTCSNCNNTFIADLTSVAYGSSSSCGCKHREQVKELNQNKIVYYQPGEEIADFGVTFIKDKTYNDNKKKQVRISFFKCPKCGETFEASPTDIKRNAIVCCKKCLQGSKGEELIKKILDEEKIKYQSQYTTKDCINPDTGYKLRFDFFLPEYNIIIEYDGIQHYKSNGETGWNTEKNLTETQKRDKIKNKYCEDNNIRLIRIPYTDFSILDKTYLLERIEA